MRVITGTARGRKLREPTGRDIRPTTDMVKESVFNIIQFKTEGARVLDLFAGTGQLGIEALSRGAAECVFVDKSEEALKLVRENLKTTGLENKAHVVRGDSLSY
ncbi:MAG: RsmD family RNA methyltransferase, partial [Oscillospiraceae bacterium]|nr:RsmD family RNA methyltransferase [Oscillospiraceae bacterium]